MMHTTMLSYNVFLVKSNTTAIAYPITDMHHTGIKILTKDELTYLVFNNKSNYKENQMMLALLS